MSAERPDDLCCNSIICREKRSGFYDRIRPLAWLVCVHQRGVDGDGQTPSSRVPADCTKTWRSSMTHNQHHAVELAQGLLRSTIKPDRLTDQEWHLMLLAAG